MKSTNKKDNTNLYIYAGTGGIIFLIAGAASIYVGLKAKYFYDASKPKLGNYFLTFFWVVLAIAIVVFIASLTILIFALIKNKKAKLKSTNKPKIAGENKKREVFVVAGAIIRDGYVFAAQRGNKGETKFKWEFPGGKIEPGETPKEALARELEEELKIKVKVHERITNIVDEYPTQILHIDTYRCELLEGNPTLTEHIDMAWSNKEELDQLEFSPADSPTLDKIKKLYL